MGKDATVSARKLRALTSALVAPALLIGAIGVVGVGGGGIARVESLTQVARGPAQPLVASSIGTAPRGTTASMEAQLLTPEARAPAGTAGSSGNGAGGQPQGSLEQQTAAASSGQSGAEPETVAPPSGSQPGVAAGAPSAGSPAADPAPQGPLPNTGVGPVDEVGDEVDRLTDPLDPIVDGLLGGRASQDSGPVKEPTVFPEKLPKVDSQTLPKTSR